MRGMYQQEHGGRGRQERDKEPPTASRHPPCMCPCSDLVEEAGGRGELRPPWSPVNVGFRWRILPFALLFSGEKICSQHSPRFLRTETLLALFPHHFLNVKILTYGNHWSFLSATCPWRKKKQKEKFQKDGSLIGKHRSFLLSMC